MELLKYVNTECSRYTLREVIDQHIVFIVRSKIDLCNFMMIAIDKNTIKTFDAVRTWNKYVADESKGYDGTIAIEVVKNNNNKYYEYKLTFGWVGFYTKFKWNEKYIVVEYSDDIISDWSVGES